MAARFSRALAITLWLPLIGGCITTHEDDLKRSFDSFVGSPVSNFALQNGPPHSVIDMDQKRKAFQWVRSGQTPGAAMMMPGTGMMVYRAPGQTSCQISLIAVPQKPSASPSNLSEWIVDSYAWNGYC